MQSNQAVRFYKNQFCKQTEAHFLKSRNIVDQFAYQVEYGDDQAVLMAQDVASYLIKAVKARAQQ